jgi:hypothetical protein
MLTLISLVILFPVVSELFIHAIAKRGTECHRRKGAKKRLEEIILNHSGANGFNIISNFNQIITEPTYVLDAAYPKYNQ